MAFQSTWCLTALTVTLLACDPNSGGGLDGEPFGDGGPTENLDDAGGAIQDSFEGDCRGIVADGDGQGDIAANWTLIDHIGRDVSLHDFCGEVIFFEEGAYW